MAKYESNTAQRIQARADFHHIHVDGHARVHIGHHAGNITNNYCSAPLGAEDTRGAEEIRKALFETDPEIDRQNLMFMKGDRAWTCEWIAEHLAYKAWLRGDHSLLWISGGPGRGKTMLADFIVHDLSRICSDDVAVLYFFCLSQDPKRNNIASIIRGLLYHLLRTRPELLPFLTPHLGAEERRSAALSSPDMLWAVFTAILEQLPVFCVLDGIDECSDDTYSFLTTRLAAQSPEVSHSFRVAILGRPLAALDTPLHIRLDPDNNEMISHDIDLYITTKLKFLTALQDDTVRHKLHEVLLKRAEGTFLWVGFVMIELLKQKTVSSVWDCLAQIPSGLPALYARMLNRIPERYRTSCRTVLMWAAAAVRPLKIAEMAGILDGSLRGPPGPSQIQMVQDLVTECGSIATVESDHIVLVHQSARDYLFRDSPDNDMSVEYWRFDRASANIDLLRSCVKCVETNGNQKQVLPSRWRQKAGQKAEFRISTSLLRR